MDKLIKISGVHKIISEMPAMYKEMLGKINFYNPLEYAQTMNKVFEETILPHFEFEEKEIFPFIYARGSDEVRKIVLIVQEQHKQLAEKMNGAMQLKDKLEEAPDTAGKEKLAALCSQIAAELNEHALKEDAVLFPLLKNSAFNSQ